MKWIENTYLLWALAGILGYVLGSISFARVITFLKTRSPDVNEIDRKVEGDSNAFHSDSISATAVHLNLGRKFGCLTALLDMAKVALPTALIRYFFGDQPPYYLLCALMGMVGHNYPVFHRFKGGRGQSPLIGGLLVINWFGILLANLAALLLGYITASVLVIRWGWMVLVIFWFAWYFKDPFHIVYIVLANFLFWYAMRTEIQRFLKIRSNQKPSQERISEFLFMGKDLGRFMDRYGLRVLIARIIAKLKGRGSRTS